ncbi:MAG: glucose-6-phosphate isomerase [Leptospiraceae bacterium]|nr:glucose-6-phosphate isomerase [Leptospiraceae bacterium]
MMKQFIELDFDFVTGVSPDALEAEAVQARDLLENRNGPGNDFLGWLDLPLQIDNAQLDELRQAADTIRRSEGLVIVGIGGSYLGARAVLEALRSPFSGAQFPIYYAGHQLDAEYHAALLEFLKVRRYAVNVISKSGTTTEPGLAFRFLWRDLNDRFSADDIKKMVFATTDAQKGSLRKLADEAGLKTFVIPDDVGGRFSVFTPVGLLPIAAGGLNVASFVEGAHDMRAYLKSDAGRAFAENPALQYAAYRNACYQNGKKIEIFAAYQSALLYVAEWWKQLYGESEGKNGKGIFPASVNLSTDLHSLGQWMQDGERTIFETVIDVARQKGPVIQQQENNADGLNYLAGKTLHEVNRTALQATLAAHRDGGVPCLQIRLGDLNEYALGALLYMFEYACGVSAYMLGVNPFDQPGVEAYKQNMFRLLGKP